MKNLYVFDLDDTLYKEIEFVESGYRAICSFLNIEDVEGTVKIMLSKLFEKNDAIGWLIENYNPKVYKEDLVELYRSHVPILKLEKSTKILLDTLFQSNHSIGLITDGRSITQRNKLKALGIEHIFDKIIISEEIGTEKPSMANFVIFENYAVQKKYYIADNCKKDFVTPNLLNWETICLLDNGQNIHKQNFELENKFLPKYKIENILDVLKFL